MTGKWRGTDSEAEKNGDQPKMSVREMVGVGKSGGVSLLKNSRATTKDRSRRYWNGSKQHLRMFKKAVQQGRRESTPQT